MLNRKAKTLCHELAETYTAGDEAQEEAEVIMRFLEVRRYAQKKAEAKLNRH